MYCCQKTMTVVAVTKGVCLTFCPTFLKQLQCCFSEIGRVKYSASLHNVIYGSDMKEKRKTPNAYVVIQMTIYLCSIVRNVKIVVTGNGKFL